MTLAPSFSARSRRYASITSRLQAGRQQHKAQQQAPQQTTLGTSTAAGMCRHAASTAQHAASLQQRHRVLAPHTVPAAGRLAARVLVSPAHADVLSLAECPAHIHLAVGGGDHLHLGHLCRTGAGAGAGAGRHDRVQRMREGQASPRLQDDCARHDAGWKAAGCMRSTASTTTACV